MSPLGLECYTPPLKKTRDARRLVAGPLGVIPDDLHYPRSASRPELLHGLALDIRRGEESAETLFRAFDLSICDPVEGKSQAPPSIPTCISEMPGSGHHAELSRNPSTARETPYKVQKGSYLSTPLRKAYFPNLSPSILKILLRSPSIHFPSPDHSFGDTSFESGAVEDSFTRVAQPRASTPLFSKTIPSRQTVTQASPNMAQEDIEMPLTPPPSVRIPDSRSTPAFPQELAKTGSTSPKLSSPVQQRSLDLPSRHALDCSSFASPPCHGERKEPDAPVDLSTELTALVTSETVNELEGILQKNPSLRLTLLEPSALRYSLRVIRELKGLQDNWEERRKDRMGASDDRCNTGEKRPCASPPFSSRIGSSQLSPETGFSLPPNNETSYFDSSLNSSTYPLPILGDRSVTLQEEFAALLLAQAAEEERQAAELREIADRLLNMALTRRRLAGVTIARSELRSGRRECFVFDS
ncbi:hypothetical protein JAAARDRAFT_238052 [Jaapia argillacea MUCL 33604]|uniref:Uncharacterized protein n=1 Tax=Jaapia argillacea MUCL 33604 TaxID=933084 RepID=A0A067QQ68_9AGAM|nr:hypothetical protein JAAARDRAFT_238052 [Jaapia argillacea MUCL 33604]